VSRHAQGYPDGTFDTDWTDEMICPHCGYIVTEAWEITGSRESGEHDCEECGKSFAWTENMTIRYTTTKGKP